MILYGIPNCDTVAKARKFLDQHRIAYRFHDVRADGLTVEVVEGAYSQLAEKTFNTRSPSWRALSADDQSDLKSGSDFSAATTQPTVLKRPLVHREGQYFNGFNAQQWATIFNLD